jgi:Holliday junction resolvase RusA-like endonuclease
LGKSISFTVYGAARPKQGGSPITALDCTGCRKRVYSRPCTHCGSSTLTYVGTFMSQSSTVKTYENIVAMSLREAMTSAGVTRLEGPLKLSATFYMPIAKTRKGLNEGDGHTQRPDLTNLIKCVEDGIKALAFADDCQICWQENRKVWTRETPRCELVIEELA